MIPDVVEGMRETLTEILEDDEHYFTADWTPELNVESAVDAILTYVQTTLPHIQAQTLRDAADALDGKPLLNKPFNEYYPEWLRKRADEAED